MVKSNAVRNTNATTLTEPRKRRVTFNNKAHRARPHRLAPFMTAIQGLDEDVEELNGWPELRLLDPAFDELECDPLDLLCMKWPHEPF